MVVASGTLVVRLERKVWALHDTTNTKHKNGTELDWHVKVKSSHPYELVFLVGGTLKRLASASRINKNALLLTCGNKIEATL